MAAYFLIKESPGIQHVDADGGNPRGNGSKNRMGIACPQASQHGQGFNIGNEVTEKLSGCDLSHEQGVTGLQFLKGLQHLADLANFNDDAF